MNGLEEIKKIIKNFDYEAEQSKLKISQIENERMQLANERNEKKHDSTTNYIDEINELGHQISELGNKSQELQNKLDTKFNDVKKIVDLTIDNIITDKIRKIRKMDEEKQELEIENSKRTEKNAKYEIKKQEFFERFGRVPELSKKAQKEEEIQEKQNIFSKTKIEDIRRSITNMETELVDLASIKRNFKNRTWNYIIE